MAKVSKWIGVAVGMESAKGAPKTITGITKASPAVASSTAHGYVNGDYVRIAASGMTELDGRVFRCIGVTANTFNLEGIDSTLFGTFTAGTAESITFGISITTATEITPSGGTFDFISITTVHDNTKSEVPGMADGSKFELKNIWDVSEPGLLAMKAASDAQAQKAFKFTWGTGGQVMAISGYVGASLLPGGESGGMVSTPSVITSSKLPTYYAS
jgi:hypothetical protein